jgi:hypothetical protein
MLGSLPTGICGLTLSAGRSRRFYDASLRSLCGLVLGDERLELIGINGFS